MEVYLPLPERLLWIVRKVDQLAGLTGPDAPPGFVEAFDRREWWAWYAANAVELAIVELDCALYPRLLIGEKVPLNGYERGALLYDRCGWPEIVDAALTRLDNVLTDLFTRWGMVDLITGCTTSFGRSMDYERGDILMVAPTVDPCEHEALLWISRTLSRGVADLPCSDTDGLLAIPGEPRDISLREKALRERLWEEAAEERIDFEDRSQLPLVDLSCAGPFRCSKRSLTRAMGRGPSDIIYINTLIGDKRLACEKTSVKANGHALYDFRFTDSGLVYLEKHPRKKQGVLALMSECTRAGPPSDNPSDNLDPSE